MTLPQNMQCELVQLRNSVVMRPVGTLGTCGWLKGGVGWEAKFFSNVRLAKSYAAKNDIKLSEKVQ